MEFSQARDNMVQQQLRPWDVSDERLLKVMSELPRELFVPEPYQECAYSDTQISLGSLGHLPEPKLAARLIQALHLLPHSQVLEIGPGSGYSTALLAKLVKKVTVIDVNPVVIQNVQSVLKALKIHNVVAKTVPLPAEGYLETAPYDAILINNSLPYLSPSLRLQLKNQGHMVAIVGVAPVMQAVAVTRLKQHEWYEKTLFETDLPRLPGVKPDRLFQF